ncbi:MAG TPA: hypothetical protein VL326_22330 [Kofleriaceae bacterium]|nr:hypothetical protein [Kofleriaceae bacterium]
MHRWVMLVATLAACGGGGVQEPVKPIGIKPTPATAPPPKPACIRAPDDNAAITHARVDASHVSYCIGAAVDQCFKLDLESGKLEVLPEAPEAQDKALTPVGHVETTNPELKVCNANGCKTLTPQVWPGAAPLHAATNGSVAAVLLGDAEAGKGYVDVYDVSKPKKLSTFKYARGDFKCGDVAMLGDVIYVAANVCANPSGRGALYTAKGKKIANVGGKADFGTYGGAYTQLDEKTWAFLEENGNIIAVQDVVKGKVLKTIDVTQLFDNVKMGNPGESAIVRLGSGKVAVIGGTPANGSVAIVDPTSGEVKVVKAPLCGTSG